MKTDYNIDILNKKEFLTIKESAFFLNISEKTVRRMIESDEIKCHRVRKNFRIRKKDIEKYLEKSVL